jgi:flagellar basal body-associated protein FliL
MPDVEVSPAPEKAPRKSILWLAIVLALGLVAAGVFFWLRSEPSTSAGESTVAQSTLTLETFVVNLNASGQRGYLRVGITLGLAYPIPRNKPEAVPMALVRDTILSVLATAQPEALLGLEGKRQLKDELLKALRERVPQMAVENVYFTEFLVQM